MAATKKGSTVKKAGAEPAAPAASEAGKATPAKARRDAKTSPKAPTGEKAVAKKAAPVKLTAKQAEFLGKIHAAGEAGFEPTKAEMRGVESLLDKKLIKKGAKNKATGQLRFHVTKAGQKHLPSTTAEPAPMA